MKGEQHMITRIVSHLRAQFSSDAMRQMRDTHTRLDYLISERFKPNGITPEVR